MARDNGTNAKQLIEMRTAPTFSSIYVMDDGKLVGQLPMLPGTVSKPVTWGQIKADPSVAPTYSAKPVVDDHANEIARAEEEYRQKLASLR